MKHQTLDDIVDMMDRAYEMALSGGFVEYAAQIKRLSNKMQVEADFWHSQEVGKPVYLGVNFGPY